MDEEIDSLRATIVRLREAVQAVSGSDEVGANGGDRVKVCDYSCSQTLPF